MTEQDNDVDVANLRKLYNGSPCAKAILDNFASRQQDRSETNVDRMLEKLAVEGQPFSRREVIDVFRALQTLGAGSFIVGRKTHPSRFQRRVSLIELGKAARGDREGISPPVIAPSMPVKSDVIAHRYVLRPDFTVTVQLPSDLKSAEANRFGDFIKTLPFS